MSRGAKLLIAATAAAMLGGCGSSHSKISPLTASTHGAGAGRKTFSAPGMALHFTFPDAFTVKIAQSKRKTPNASGASQAAVGISRYDLLVVSRFPNRPIPVTRANLRKLKPQFDQAVSYALGHKVSSTAGTVAGLPALTYPPSSVAGLPVKVSSRIIDVFVADDEYELNCQYTPAKAKAINAACDQMLSTLSPR